MLFPLPFGPIREVKVPSYIEEEIFIKNVRQRVGEAIQIDIQYVNHIPCEKSGKFRIVKNNLKLDDL